MGYTLAELAEMAFADAEIEDSFCISQEDIEFSRKLEKAISFERLDPKKRRFIEQRRKYYAANKEKIAEKRRRYIAANRDKLAVSRRRYLTANKVKIAASRRWYKIANKAKIAEYNHCYYAANRAKLREDRRRYLSANKAKASEGKQAIYELRKSLGMSQHRFASMLGVTQSTVSYWENVREPENWREICAAHAPKKGVIRYEKK